jgi:hypothetical protein
MTGLPIVLGNDRSPHETFMQVAGNGVRIPAPKLREAIAQSRSLELALLAFAHRFLNQTASTALSNGTATLEERLPRWLLMANDRLRGDEVPLTHEFLSLMLGVRRAGVTVALHYLEQRLARKQIVTTDRKAWKPPPTAPITSPRSKRSFDFKKRGPSPNLIFCTGTYQGSIGCSYNRLHVTVLTISDERLLRFHGGADAHLRSRPCHRNRPMPRL